MPLPRHLAARRHLSRVDPTLGALIRRAGPCRLGHHLPRDPFQALLQSIVSQQLSVKAADTILGRLEALFPKGRPDPARLLVFSDEELRGAGLSGQKLRYMRDLSARVLDGRLRLSRLHTLADDEVRQALVEVKGIGRWTAEIFLMFTLGRPDILPADDLGLQNAAHRLYGLRRRPTPDRLLTLGEAWRPHRSVASWYLWRSLELPRASSRA
ncbi:MAG: DNA-3-methyladenine glycosylase [Vicinamibacterales bacterium]|nr:DNA-3-methyladenine glycosylase [Vicinamibacterales bacterium]